ncbi:hypothetical protein AB4Y38_40790 [Paraburkholderia sp. EG285A]|uniref:hypothetical protein n=1 Tax=Paraburkholderia sp. EG285A TaxID=3237009 RepID=UPI0034D35D0D
MSIWNERRAMLRAAHMAPLAAYVERLRAAAPHIVYPDFDPMDAGINAEILFVMEK